ncbi:MAG TPA: dTDP-4-dehydrorhamnose 3,5-epimerase family protein [Chloroflexia bacterium]|nr:dTDP-4-dehydrorhamnose 3,5-epimerase family protein [Chloroflexia bacterium]
MPHIEGVVIKELITYPDERGYFREMIRVTDPFFGEGFAQLSHSLMHPGSAKAWHIHKTQVDWWYVPIGVLKVALYDTRDDSPTKGALQELFMGEEHGQKVLKIPPGVAHGCKAIGGTAHLIYVTSAVYDQAEEGRIPHDDPGIGYDWVSGPTIK